jgi:hypothetical protein
MGSFGTRKNQLNPIFSGRAKFGDVAYVSVVETASAALNSIYSTT